MQLRLVDPYAGTKDRGGLLSAERATLGSLVWPAASLATALWFARETYVHQSNGWDSSFYAPLNAATRVAIFATVAGVVNSLRCANKTFSAENSLSRIQNLLRRDEQWIADNLRGSSESSAFLYTKALNEAKLNRIRSREVSFPGYHRNDFTYGYEATLHVDPAGNW